MRDFRQFRYLPTALFEAAAAGRLSPDEFWQLVERFRNIDTDQAWDRLSTEVQAPVSPRGADGAATGKSPVIRIPRAVFEGYRRRRNDHDRLSLEQFQIYVAAYSWANWTDTSDWRVSSYSAARVCEFWGLDASEATLRRFERAAANLLNRCLIRRDYRKGTERTYSLWIPNPCRFAYIGNAEENGLSLWKSNVGVLVGDNVGVQELPSSEDTGDYEQQETDNVGVDVGDSALQLSITYQENQENREKDPLNPLRGLDHPPAPPVGGEHSSPLGAAQTPLGLEIQKPHREDKTTRSLSVDRCKTLASMAIDFRMAWINAFGGFDPKQDDVYNLLRKFSPWAICVAYVGIGARKQHKFLARFFGTTAADAIVQRREQGTEFVLDFNLNLSGDGRIDWDNMEKFEPIQEKWCALFGQELPFRFWVDGRLPVPWRHFYHPALEQLLSVWKTKVDAPAKHMEQS